MKISSLEVYNWHQFRR